MSPKRPRLSPKYQWKRHLPGKRFLCQKKGQSLNPTKSHATQRNRPKPSQQRLPEEKEPQSQHRLPGEGAPEPAVPRGHPKPSQNRLPRATRLSKAPRSVDVSPGHTEGGHPRPAISPDPEVTRGSIQIRFLAITSPRRPAGEKEAYFVTPARPVSPNNFQTPIGASSGGQAPPSPHSRRSPSLRPSGGPRPTVIRQV